MAGNEPVTSPDQHKPTPIKAARIAGTLTIFALLLMTIGNHEGHVEDLWLIGIAATIAIILISDAVLRRNGLRST
ncbi:DUF2631 domain-containing protein [Hamadaea tsunoensis]|uniref:DUF2631 domain-containing protein n=1 Tax=Hamadaea tsunoensis TaxID=53368 RepID=UPI00041FD739|nr:DUF2631 domain-containing protein [Hamadaea tsunoensis]